MGYKILNKVRRILAIALVAWCIIYVSHILELPGIYVSDGQHKAIFLGLLLALTFLLYPARKGMVGIKWYDWLLITISLVPTAYVVLFKEAWDMHGGTKPEDYEVIFCLLLIVALLEGLRRVLGIVLPIIMLFFVLHPLLSNHLPGILFGRGYSLTRITGQFFFAREGIFGMPLHIAATIIIAFLLFGQFLVSSGAGKTMMDAALSIVGKVRGGPAKAAVVSSALFGTLSGNVAANVATTGTFTIPLMKAYGYKPEFAAAVEACASNGGHIMPPVLGAVAFIMAEMISVPYFEIAYISFIPAIMYYICMFVQVDLEAARGGLRGLPPSQIPSFKNTISTGWIHAIPPLILIYLLFVPKYSPELAAFWSVISIVVIMAFRKKTRLSPGKIMDALEGSAKGVIVVGLACAMAGIIMASVSLTGIAVLLSGDIVKIAGGNLLLLLVLAAIASFIFGMGIGTIPTYVFVAIMIAPALTQVGIPLLSAHFFVFWLAMGSFITPPVCVAAFVAAAIAGSSPMRTGLKATMLGIGIFILPFAFIYSPALMLRGSFYEIVLAVFFNLLGLLSMAIGFEGYLLKQANWWQRVLFLGAGIMMFVPNWWIRLLGFGAMAAAIIWQIKNIHKILPANEVKAFGSQGGK